MGADEDKGSRVGVIFRNTTSSFARYFLQVVLLMLLLPYIVRMLGKEGYGLWAFATALLGFFGFMDLGFSTAVVKYVAQYRGAGDDEGLRKLASTLQAVYWTIAAAVAGAVVVLGARLEHFFEFRPSMVEEARTVVLALGLRTAFNFPYSFFRGVLLGHQKHSLVNAFKMSELLLNAAATVTVLHLGGGAAALAVSTACVSLAHYAALAAVTLHQHPEVRFSPRLFDFSSLREASSFSLYSFLVNLGVVITANIDLMVLKHFMSMATIAVYSIGQKMANYTFSFSKQFVNTLTPVIAELKGAEDTERIRSIYLKGTRMALIVSLPVALGIVVLAPRLVRVWMGEGFDGSAVVVRILVLTSLVTLTQAAGSNVLAMTGRHRLLAGVTLLSAFLNLALSILLVRTSLGYAGVALATFITALVCDVAVLIPCAVRHVGSDAREFTRRVILPVLGPTAVLLAALIWLEHLLEPSSLPGLAMVAAGASLAYAPAAWRLGLTRSERSNYLGRLLSVLERFGLKGRRRTAEIV